MSNQDYPEFRRGDWVRRIKDGCCGMKAGGTYEVVEDSTRFYVCVKLPNGQCIQPHYIPGYFEKVKNNDGG